MSFETRLQARLQAAAEQVPGERIVFGDALARAHRARRIHRFAVAVAGTAVVAGLVAAGWALAGAEGPKPLPPVDEQTPTPTPTPTPSEEYDDGLPDDIDFAPLTAAVDDFLAAAADSDAAAMWDLMSDEARARFDDFAAFEEFAVEVNAETLGAWASATRSGMGFEGIELPTVETGILVTVYGEVTQEGSTRNSQLVMPMRLSGSGNDATVAIDAFTQEQFEVTATVDGDISSVDPLRVTRLPSDAAYEARAAGVASAARINLVLEFDEPAMPVAPAVTELEVTPDGSIARWQTEGALPGNYALVVAFVAEDGAIEVQSFPVRVTR
jgi:hypothetical protein